ncbi:MAG: SRPBCC family protein [Limnohabitans sp.]
MSFTHHLQTQVHIQATAEQVWSVLMDFERYPQWNPFIRQVVGCAVRGQTLCVEVQPVGGKPMRFKPTVVQVEPASEWRWLGKFLFTGLFDGEHFFRLEPVSDGVVLVHGEHFCGLLVPLFRRMLQQQTLPGFEAMNEALRKQVESCARGYA